MADTFLPISLTATCHFVLTYKLQAERKVS